MKLNILKCYYTFINPFSPFITIDANFRNYNCITDRHCENYLNLIFEYFYIYNEYKFL